MKVLVACEYSGVVRDAFIRAGHDAVSCDILPSESDLGPHIQGDVLELLGESFDLVVAHPPCTYLSHAGVRWLVSDPGRMVRVREGAEFFARMFDFNAPRICVENPVQHTPARECHGKGRPAQYVHPWQFGHMEQKKTGLWLRNLPKLLPTGVVKEEMMKLPVKDRQRLNWLPATKDRAKIRSKTFQGIADAMAAQWGVL